MTIKQLDKLKKLHDEGGLTDAAIEAMHRAGKITAEERDYILGVD